MVLNKLITFHDPWGHQIQSKLSVLLFTGQAILRRNRTGPKVTITPCWHSLLLYVLQPPLDQLPGVLPQLKCAPTTHSYQEKKGGAQARGWRADVGGSGDFGPCSQFWLERWKIPCDSLQSRKQMLWCCAVNIATLEGCTMNMSLHSVFSDYNDENLFTITHSKKRSNFWTITQ